MNTNDTDTQNLYHVDPIYLTVPRSHVNPGFWDIDHNAVTAILMDETNGDKRWYRSANAHTFGRCFGYHRVAYIVPNAHTPSA